MTRNLPHLFLLFVGLGFAWLVWDGFRNNRMFTGRDSISREDDPFLYWFFGVDWSAGAAVVIMAAIGAMTTLG